MFFLSCDCRRLWGAGRQTYKNRGTGQSGADGWTADECIDGKTKGDIEKGLLGTENA